MSRRVRRKVVSKGKEKVGCCPDNVENLILGDRDLLDWTRLPDDTVIQLFSSLNYRDRASLSSTCQTWRNLGKSPCLWQDLDLRPHKCDAAIARSLANRCEDLRKLRFHGPEPADAIMHLQAKNLREIRGDGCKKLSDATLSVLVARHEALEFIQIEPDYCYCDRFSSDGVKSIALCCPNLKTLRLTGVYEVSAEAINALANHCKRLADIAFIDCRSIDETSLANVASLCYLSIAGTVSVKWNVVAEEWSKLPNLIGLDVSRTDITPDTVSKLFSPSLSLKVLCALSCPGLEGDATFVSNRNHKGKVLLASFTDILNQVGSLLVEMPKSCTNAFLDWRKSEFTEKKFKDIMNWLEWIISYSLLRISENNPPGLDDFWLNQGTTLMLSLVQSMNEDVQERTATALATFIITDDDSSGIDVKRADAVMQNGGIRILLNLAQSWSEGLQSEAAKAIANLSVNSNVAKAVAEEGGISLLTSLAKSKNRMVAEEAAGGLWNLSVGEEHKVAIAEVGAVQALVDLIFKWSKSPGGESVLERAAGALANIAADDNCSMEVASIGGVQALVMLARDFKAEGVQEQSARALANLAAHGDSNCNNAAVGREAGSIDALVQLTRSTHEGVRQEAAGALWNLSFDDTNREAIAAVGGIEALVALAVSCQNGSHGLQERAAGALWGLSVSEANSIAIGQEGGIPPLIKLARSEAEDVHETAAGALWNLAFNPGNALRIVEEGGVPALVNLCSSSVSKMARFMSALAMAYMFDGRMEKNVPFVLPTGTPKTVHLEATRRMALKNIEAFVKSFSNPPAFAAATVSSAPAALAMVTESARLHEAGQLRCSQAEIGRFVHMLRNPCPILKSCAAFALLQFTVSSSRHSAHHVSLLNSTGAARILRAAAAAANAPIEAKIFARIVLRNMELHKAQNIC